MLNPFKSTLGTRLLAWLHQHPRAYAAARSVANLRGLLPAYAVDGLPGKIHRNDFMALDLPSYIASSKAHFQALGEDMAAAGKPWDAMASFIDFGCGYGRVTRWLPTVLPPDQITACDVTRPCVRWCERAFGVNGLVAKPEIRGTAFGSYDGLFACSVVTHLSAPMIEVFLQSVAAMVRPGGVAVFTGKGSFSAQSASATKEYITDAEVQAALSDSGFFFKAYPHYGIPDLGDTFFTRDWLVQRLPSALELLDCKVARYWTHDGYVVRKK